MIIFYKSKFLKFWLKFGFSGTFLVRILLNLETLFLTRSERNERVKQFVTFLFNWQFN